MLNRKFCVYNLTRECVLSLEVTVVDTMVEPFKRLVEDLANQARGGHWLKPYRGIPFVRGLHPFDLVYLDEDYLVVQVVESFPRPDIELLDTGVASALVLPTHTISASHTRPGDQLEFSLAEERKHGPESLAKPITPPPAASSTISPAMESQGNRGSAPSEADERAGQMRRAVEKMRDKQEAESKTAKKPSLIERFMRWLHPDSEDPGRARRHPLPGLVAYHWTGGAPQAHRIGDISITGLYLLTEDRMFPGTIIEMTLQRTETDSKNPENSIAVLVKVVRWGPDGTGLQFVFSPSADQSKSASVQERGTDMKALVEFLQKLNLPERKEQQSL
jgi:hypothetical protein